MHLCQSDQSHLLITVLATEGLIFQIKIKHVALWSVRLGKSYCINKFGLFEAKKISEQKMLNLS